MYASMPQCAKIILGASHDNGYARVLSQLETENVVPGKIMLLKGPPFAAELDLLATSTFPRLEFGDLFMATKLESAKNLNHVQLVALDGVLQLPRKTASPAKSSTAVLYKQDRTTDGSVLSHCFVDIYSCLQITYEVAPSSLQQLLSQPKRMSLARL